MDDPVEKSAHIQEKLHSFSLTSGFQCPIPQTILSFAISLSIAITVFFLC